MLEQTKALTVLTDLLNATADRDRQGQAAHRMYRQITQYFEFTSGKDHPCIMFFCWWHDPTFIILWLENRNC